jgi:SAM-dependent methyltransferase
VTGVDISEEMIKHARSKAEDNPNFLIGDAYELEFERGTFHLVTCCNGLHVMKEPETALHEMRRVLKGSGRLVTINYCYGEATFGEKWDLFVQYLKLGKPAYWHNFMPKKLRKMHTNAGFKVLKCEYCREHPPAVVTVARKSSKKS